MTDHAHELRRYARKIVHPAGDVPAVMLAAADEIERLHSVIAGLRADFETAHARMMTSAEREREACSAICDEEADKMEQSAQRAIEDGEHDEVSAIRSTAWKLSVAASRIRKRGEE